MARTLADPPDFERWATKGTPQDHMDEGHTIRFRSDEGWWCETCDERDQQRLIVAMRQAHRAKEAEAREKAVTDKVRALIDELRLDTAIAMNCTGQAAKGYAAGWDDALRTLQARLDGTACTCGALGASDHMAAQLRQIRECPVHGEVAR